MDNAALINTEEHKYWNSDSADYWVTQKQALDQLLEIVAKSQKHILPHLKELFPEKMESSILL